MPKLILPAGVKPKRPSIEELAERGRSLPPLASDESPTVPSSRGWESDPLTEIRKLFSHHFALDERSGTIRNKAS